MATIDSRLPTDLYTANRWTRVNLLAAGAYFLIPATLVLANVGTALMLTRVAHLLLGNFVIGMIEGLCVARLARVRWGRAVAFMVVANYVSFIVGDMSLVPLILTFADRLPGPDYSRVIPVLASGAVLCYVVTVAIEWPFVHRAIRSPGASTAGRALRLSAAVNALSYLVLVLVYHKMGTLELFRNADIQSDLAFVKPPIVDVYFVDRDSLSVGTIRSDGTGRATLDIQLDSAMRVGWPRLFFQNAEFGEGLDLCAKPDNHTPHLVLLPNAAVEGLPRADGADDRALLMRPDRQEAPGGSMSSCHWTAVASFWATPGLSIYRDEELQYSLGYEVVFRGPFDGASRAPVFLPSGQLLFQLGNDLVILDPESRKLGYLCRGVGPAVVVRR